MCVRACVRARARVCVCFVHRVRACSDDSDLLSQCHSLK